ncbi:hypothetical protein [Desulfitobacterium hafniense]|nr:hypothetical protein [Desulfitobacterium hafniense]
MKKIEIRHAVAASDMYQLLSRFLHLPIEEIMIGIDDSDFLYKVNGCGDC